MLKLQAQSSRALSNALNVASRCMVKKNTMAILDNVLLSQKDDSLFFTTSSAEAQLTVAAPLNIIDGTFTTPIALPINGIISFLSTLPDSVVTFTINDGLEMTMNYCLGSDDKVKEGSASLTCLDGCNFPFISGLKGEDCMHIELPTDALIGAIDLAKDFTAKDDLRVTMNTLFVDVPADPTECYFVATDGKVLYKKTYNGNFFIGGHPAPFMIHNSYFRALSAFTGCEKVDVQTDGNTLRFASDTTEFICKAVEGNYPNYNAVIPKQNPYNVVFDKKEMLDAVKRVSIFGNTESGLIKLEKNGMFVTVSSFNNEYGTGSSEQVFIDNASCIDGFSIGVNSAYFTSTLSAIDADSILMEMSDPSRPCICKASCPSPRTLTLCMPMRIE